MRPRPLPVPMGKGEPHLIHSFIYYNYNPIALNCQLPHYFGSGVLIFFLKNSWESIDKVGYSLYNRIMPKYDSNSKTERNRLIVTLVRTRPDWSLKEIGQFFDPPLSRQRVWLINRRWKEK